MYISNLVVIVPVDRSEGNDITVWQQTAELLQPMLGKEISRFEPAVNAWRQSTGSPFSVVFGKRDPALFLYFYSMAKEAQGRAIQHHMAGVLDHLDISQKFQNEEVLLCAVNVKDNDKAVAAHMSWHLAMMEGKLLPDCAIYYKEDKRSACTEELDKKVITQMERYALCVVRLIVEGNHAD